VVLHFSKGVEEEQEQEEHDTLALGLMHVWPRLYSTLPILSLSCRSGCPLAYIRYTLVHEVWDRRGLPLGLSLRLCVCVRVCV